MTPPLRTITVLGAGSRGLAVCLLAARAGYPTVLEDISGQREDLARDRIRALAASQARAEGLSSGQVEEWLDRVKPENSLDRAVANADLVIEAVPDDLETLVEVYTLIDKAAPPGCVFASTTPAFSIAEIAALTYRPAQVLGMRFPALPVQSQELVMVIGRETSEETVCRTEQVGLRMGKKLSRVQESPGPAVFRLQEHGTRS